MSLPIPDSNGTTFLSNLNAAFNNFIPLVTTETIYTAAIPYSNQSATGTAFSDTPSDGSSPGDAFNGVSGGYYAFSWTSSLVSGDLGFHFVNPTVIDQISIAAADPSSPNDFQFYGSTNGSDYVLLDHLTGVSGWNGSVKYFPFTNTTAYNYYRINVNTNNGWRNTAIEQVMMYTSSTSSGTYPLNPRQGEFVCDKTSGYQLRVYDNSQWNNVS